MTCDMIITHDGKFHMDEVLACVMLKKIYPFAMIYRTRDNNTIKKYIKKGRVLAVVDVFEKYDAENGYFDHHQKSFNININGVKCSSSGLVFTWHCFNILDAYNIKTKHKNRLIRQIYLNYIRMVDAKDNGIDIECTINLDKNRKSVDCSLGLTKKNNLDENDHHIYLRTIVDVVAGCKNFDQAFNFVYDDFENFMRRMKEWIKKYDKIITLLREKVQDNKFLAKNDFSRQILITDKMINVGKLVCEIEKSCNLDIKFTIDLRGKYCYIYAVTLNTRYNALKNPSNPRWAGLTGKELISASGISGAVLVNSNGSLGICTNLDDAYKMCYKSINK